MQPASLLWLSEVPKLTNNYTITNETNYVKYIYYAVLGFRCYNYEF
jgi:hypothetical protein